MNDITRLVIGIFALIELFLLKSGDTFPNFKVYINILIWVIPSVILYFMLRSVVMGLKIDVNIEKD